MSTPDPYRLQRIEKKVDGLAEAVIDIARMDEKIIAILGRMDSADTRADHHSNRITTLTDRVVNLEKAHISLSFIERVLWVGGTAVISGGVMYFFSNVV